MAKTQGKLNTEIKKRLHLMAKSISVYTVPYGLHS